MKWPWVSRRHFDAVFKGGVKEIAAREAAIVYEQQAHAETKATLGRMTIMCRELETKLRDCTDPPITRKELEDLTKRHSFVVRKAEVLEEKCSKLEAELKELHDATGAAPANGAVLAPKA